MQGDSNLARFPRSQSEKNKTKLCCMIISLSTPNLRIYSFNLVSQYFFILFSFSSCIELPLEENKTKQESSVILRMPQRNLSLLLDLEPEPRTIGFILLLINCMFDKK